MNLITAGLIFEPQIVADQWASGSYEFLRSLPVPRSMTALAWYTVAPSHRSGPGSRCFVLTQVLFGAGMAITGWAGAAWLISRRRNG